MKYIFSIILALSIAQNAGAQGVSAGLRTGIGNTMDITRVRDGIIDKHWEKELFLRYETKKRLAFEVGGNQYNDSKAGIWHNSGCIVDYEPLYFDAPTHKNLLTLTNYNMVDVSLGIQYDISFKTFQEKCPIMRHFRSFVGANVVGTFGKATTHSTDRRISDGDISTTQYNESGIYSLYVGASHTMVYSFKRLYLTSVVSYVVRPDFGTYQYLEQPIPNSKLSFRAGIGYKIF